MLSYGDKLEHRRGVIYAFVTPVPLLALLLFWNAGWAWSVGVSLSLGLLLAWIQHRHPAFVHALGGDHADPRQVAREEVVRGINSSLRGPGNS